MALIAKARGKLINAMISVSGDSEMTALEWLEVLSVMADRLRQDALRDEWKSDGAETPQTQPPA
jgi:hypothetical protein